MQSLSLTLRRWQGKGREVEIPFRGLADRVDFRTGQIAVVGGGSGGGKSTFCANWAWRSSQPVLYLAQEDPFSTIKTMVALATGRRRDEVSTEDVLYWSDRVSNKRDELIIETGRQTIETIEARLIALTEWLMEPPPLVIVDSLFDVRVDDASYMDAAFYAHVLPEIKRLSLQYDVGFILQHHVKRGDAALGTHSLTMTDLMFGGEKEAAHVWGIYRSENSKEMYLQILKHRNGQADPGGGLSVRLDWTPENGLLYSS